MSEEIAFIVGLLLGAVCGIFIGIGIGAHMTQNEAAKSGAGEYYIDADYTKQFRFLTNHPPLIKQIRE